MPPLHSSLTLALPRHPVTDLCGQKEIPTAPSSVSSDLFVSPIVHLRPQCDSGCFEGEWVVATPQPPTLREAGLPMPPRMRQRTLQQKMRKDGTMAACTWACLQTCPL